MTVLRAAFTVGSFTMVSRVTGFARDMLIAAALGAGPAADAFFVSLKLANLFRRLFAEGAFGSGFVPLFGRALAEGDGPPPPASPPTRRGLLLAALVPSRAPGRAGHALDRARHCHRLRARRASATPWRWP